MSQVDIRGNIILDGQTTSGFDGIADKIASWGQTIGQVGEKIWDFERDSLDIYRDYETNMLQARAALSSTYDSTVELDKVMETLGQHVQDWAQNSIFHVSDFSMAVNNAAHAGWTLEQQLEGIPQAMLLAQAGGLDLSAGLEYLARALNVTGTDFKDSSTLVDQWVTASHLANLTIEDLGDSLNRMGVTAQLTNNTAELFTMLDSLAQTGTVGSEAGTLLRGTLMRLIAPTKKAKEAMEELGATQEEYDELAGDSEALEKANKQLEAQGFSAYDANGKLKPLMETYTDLYDSLVKIAGSEEDLLKNQEVAEILAAIFPQRQISGALSFLQAVKNGWGDLYAAILDSEGAATKDAETMMSGLMGAEELFKSKWEEFKRASGEELAGPYESILNFLGTVVDKLNAMPVEQLDGLLGGLTGIAALGSALGIGSGVFKFFSMLGPWGTAAVIAAGGIGALSAYLTKVSELEFDSKFGDMAVDLDKLKESLTGFTAPDKEGHDAIAEWQEKIDGIAESYRGLAESFAQELKLDTLTNSKLTADDLDSLKKMGVEMSKTVQEGIKLAADRDQVGINALFGVKSQADYDNLSPEDQQLYDSLSEGFQSLYDGLSMDAYQVGMDLRKQLTAAFTDGDLTPDEEQAIKATIDRYNEIMAKISDAQHQQELQQMFRKSQRISKDNFESWMGQLEESYEQEVQRIWDDYDRDLAKLDLANKEYHDSNGERGIDDDTYQKAVEEITGNEETGKVGKRQQSLDANRDYYGSLAVESLDSAIRDSGWGDAWGYLAGQYQKGNISIDEKGNADFSGLDFSGVDNLDDLAKQAEALYGNRGFFENLLKGYEGFEPAQAALDLLDSLGVAADALQQEKDRQTWVDEQDKPAGERTTEYGSVRDMRSDIGSMTGEQLHEQMYALDQYIQQHGVRESQAEMERWADMNQQLGQLEGDGTNPFYEPWEAPSWYNQAIGEGLMPEPQYTEPQQTPEEVAAAAAGGEPVEVPVELTLDENGEVPEGLIGDKPLEQTIDLVLDENGEVPEDLISDDPLEKTIDLVLDENGEVPEDLVGDQPVEVPVELDTSGIDDGFITWGAPLKIPIEPYVEGTDPMASLEEQGVNVTVDGDTTNLEATIDGADGQTLMEYVSGDASDLDMKIMAEDGLTLLEHVHGDASHLASVISKYDGKTITVHIHGVKDFAEGGRATEASIFGEAGPEWAIPEKHTERTASLLNAAREASGFTWDELIDRYGGLNADANHVNVNLNYSPTINAANADGVESILEKDKARIEQLVQAAIRRAMDNAALHDDVEVYA